MRLRHVVGAAGAAAGVLAIRDLTQKKHALQRNFPVLAHARYWLETIGPELRQYIVTSNEEERPFSRDQRSWIYASAKEENNYFGFGTDVDVEHVQGHAYIKQRTFASELPDDHDKSARLPSAKVLGGPRGRDPSGPDSRVGLGVGLLGHMVEDAAARRLQQAQGLHRGSGPGRGGGQHHRVEGTLAVAERHQMSPVDAGLAGQEVQRAGRLVLEHADVDLCRVGRVGAQPGLTRAELVVAQAGDAVVG